MITLQVRLAYQKNDLQHIDHSIILNLNSHKSASFVTDGSQGLHNSRSRMYV